ncbi:UDP-N-acetylmuramoylalanine--D-glutamate ligase [Enhygromyxa salina]|uniref:UDP-N-acetylmuramoylalanine--D-glutamate ligase n=1 Tax=Enhygromyxa salina TaxID=215803 RepID=A0A2S9YHG7_9BACT|nr:UDP-N-acetylmuramoyl-L-alanine--D-glutamate ligase [Enhygromyxa salina]PRQ04539.1 UDP-N-acetylmuramoylalanine--D-glutamate ligase [Enhygromyxa salina]
MNDPSSSFRRALVVGCGHSGVAAAALLDAGGCEVRLFDQRADPVLPARLAGCPRFFGEPLAPDEAFEDLDVLVLSPGVPPGPWRERHRRLVPEAELHGELSLALAAIAAGWEGGATLPTVLITGTNGKSTVTALTGAMLAAGGLDPFIGGNLGVPLSERVLAVAEGRRARPGALVLECSSYQLETLRASPEAPTTTVAMVLNVSPDHLDRYASIDDYAETKARIFDGLDAHSLALLSAVDPFTPALRERVAPVAECLLVDGPEPPRLAEHDGALELRVGEFYRRELVALAGRHNAINALFALAAARHLGVPRDECERALTEFEALPHRMNPVAERGGVVYFDDSKATNVASVLAGLDGFERPFVLICGGRAKQGDDIGALREVLATQGRGLVAIGESADAFLAMAEGALPCVHAGDMHEAVRLASEMATRGDAVLLSPACASWDMYRSFVHRGEVFAEAIAALGSG